MTEQCRSDEIYYEDLKEHISSLSKAFLSTQMKLLNQFRETLNLELQSIFGDYSAQSFSSS
jgi:hypothetical protein